MDQRDASMPGRCGGIEQGRTLRGCTMTLQLGPGNQGLANSLERSGEVRKGGSALQVSFQHNLGSVQNDYRGSLYP